MSENGYKRKLVAILSADAQDYTRLMGEDENATVRAITSHLETMSTLAGKHRGKVVDSSGDNLLAEFASVVDAVQCAAEIQEDLKARNEELPEDRRMVFRIGINLGDVIEEGGRLYGDGVNVASRIERLADGGGICISGTAYDHVRNKLPFRFEDLGKQTVKNLAEPVRVYKVLPDGAGTQGWRATRGLTGRRRVALLVAVPGGIAAAMGAILWTTPWRPNPAPVELVAVKTQLPVPVQVEPQQAGPQERELEPARTSPRETAGIPRRSPSSKEPLAEELPGIPLPEAPSIAVLPFENMSGDPEQEYLCDGLTDDIITTLAKLPRLFVISRSSTQTYKGKPAKVERISKDLGVRYVLEGSLQRSDNRIRINAQLIDGSTGTHVWAERYDRIVGDLFRTRDQLVFEIAAAMAGKLTDGDVAMLVRRNTNSLEAWEALQRGNQYYERYTVDDNLRARGWYRNATELDPKYVNAWMNVGWTYYIEGRSFLTGEAREQAFDMAVGLANKIVEMDPSYYGGYFLLSGVHWRRGHHDEAIAYGRKAVEMEPNNTFPVATLGGILNYAGQPEEAIVVFQRAMRLSPNYRPWYLDGLGLAYHLTGQFEKAIEAFKISAKRDPKAVYPHLRLAVIFAEQGRGDEMRAEGAEVMRLNPKFSIEAWAQVHSFKDPKIHEHRKAMMMKAGLPE